MTLEIRFDNSGGDIHLIAIDGCWKQLDPEDQRLSPYQRICAQQEGLRGFLLYENIDVLEGFRLDNGKIRFYCPTCDTEYFITEDQYKKSLEEFCSSEEAKWQSRIQSN